MRIFWAVITHLESASILFTMEPANGPHLGLSNVIVDIIVAQGAANLVLYQVN